MPCCLRQLCCWPAFARGRPRRFGSAPSSIPCQEVSSNSTFRCPGNLAGQFQRRLRSVLRRRRHCNNNADECCQPPHVGKDFLVCQDRGCGWYGQLEFLLLRPYAGGGLLATGDPSQLGFEPAYRFTAGRQGSDGLGGRLRYFSYDRSDSFGGGLVSVEARYLDAEMTQVVDFRRWNLLFSGGLRYADMGINTTTANVGFDGFGLTFGAQAGRALNRSGSLRMISAARWSAVYGNGKSQTPGPVATQNDDLANIFEVNIGPQYRRQMRNGMTMTLGGGLEAQYWSNVVNIAAAGQPGAGDFGLAGFMTSFGIAR